MSIPHNQTKQMNNPLTEPRLELFGKKKNRYLYNQQIPRLSAELDINILSNNINNLKYLRHYVWEQYTMQLIIRTTTLKSTV